MEDKKSMFYTSFIDVDTWNKAKWKGVVTMTDMQSPPFLGLAFENKDAAIKIFNGLIKLLGKKDEYDELRIAIIEGEIPGEESGYSVHISSSINNIIRRCKANNIDIENSLITTVSRYHRMNPKAGTKNLEIFKNEYKKFNKYKIIPIYMSSDMKLEPLMNLAIEKQEIVFRDVNEINDKDLDYVVFGKDK